MNQLKPIKTIAGQILLYFYFLHRTNPKLLNDWITNYNTSTREIIDTSRINNEIEDNLKKISGNPTDVVNGLGYLIQKGFINSGNNTSDLSGNAVFYNISLTSAGIDIIESIEQGNEEKTRFQINFNINVNNNMNIESLIRAELGSILKSLFS